MGTCLAKPPIDTITRRLRANRERRLAMILTRQTRTHTTGRKKTWHGNPQRETCRCPEMSFLNKIYQVYHCIIYIYISPLFDASKPYKWWINKWWLIPLQTSNKRHGVLALGYGPWSNWYWLPPGSAYLSSGNDSLLENHPFGWENHCTASCLSVAVVTRLHEFPVKQPCFYATCYNVSQVSNFISQQIPINVVLQ